MKGVPRKLVEHVHSGTEALNKYPSMNKQHWRANMHANTDAYFIGTVLLRIAVLNHAEKIGGPERCTYTAHFKCNPRLNNHQLRKSSAAAVGLLIPAQTHPPIAPFRILWRAASTSFCHLQCGNEEDILAITDLKRIAVTDRTWYLHVHVRCECIQEHLENLCIWRGVL